MFDYIELFYNPKRTHTNNGMLSPVNFEIRHQKLNQAGFYKTRGTSILRLLMICSGPFLVICGTGSNYDA